MKILGFIPARGGSKGIPGKNLSLLFDKPLLNFTIEAAQASKYLSSIFLSTDDYRIMDAGRLCGLTVDYRRPDHLSGDRARVVDAVIDGLNWLAGIGNCFDAVMLLQPTSPLRTTEDIDGAIEVYINSGASSLCSVHKMSEHPYECLRVMNSKWSWLEKPASAMFGRQEYDQNFFYVNGAIYIGSTELICKSHSFIEEGKTTIYEIDNSHGLDIDEPDHLALAEFFLQKQLTNNKIL